MDKTDTSGEGYFLTIFLGVIIACVDIFLSDDVSTRNITQIHLFKNGLVNFGISLIFMVIILLIILKMFERTDENNEGTENLIIKCNCDNSINFNKNNININIECPKCHTLYLKDFSGEIKVTHTTKKENSDEGKIN